MKMQRREFLAHAGQLSALGLFHQLIPSVGFAETSIQASQTDFFLMIHIPFGWDISLCLDPWVGNQQPKESDFFIEYKQDQLIPFQNGFVGPAMAPLISHFSRMSVVNGVFVSARDNGHDSAADYMQSGNGQSTLGTFSLELEGKKFQSPFGTTANFPPNSAGKSKVILDLNPILSQKSIGSGDSLFVFDEAKSELTKSKEAILIHSDKMKKFDQLIQSFAANGNAQRHHALAAAFISGLSSTGYLQNQNVFLDTHQNHEGLHLQRLTTVWSELNDLLSFFASVEMPNALGTSLLDRTTIMVTSDFARTPALNTSLGKDHNPQTNSVLLLSPNLKPGIYGKSHLVDRESSAMGVPYLAAVPLDSKTQQPKFSKNETFILRPESLFKTLLRSMDFNPAEISPSFEKAQIMTSMLK